MSRGSLPTHPDCHLCYYRLMFGAEHTWTSPALDITCAERGVNASSMDQCIKMWNQWTKDIYPEVPQTLLDSGESMYQHLTPAAFIEQMGPVMASDDLLEPLPSSSDTDSWHLLMGDMVEMADIGYVSESPSPTPGSEDNVDPGYTMHSPVTVDRGLFPVMTPYTDSDSDYDHLELHSSTPSPPQTDTDDVFAAARRKAGRPGRPRSANSLQSTKKHGSRGNHLWEFIRDLLLQPEQNPGLLKWEDRRQGVFRFVKSDAVARLWGKKKNNSSMTYEKLSRAMRYYYKKEILDRVDGRRLVYKFGRNSSGWQEERA